MLLVIVVIVSLFGVGSGEAVSHGLIGKAMVSELFLVVALTMALTPLLAEIGQRLGKAFEKSDVKVRTCVALSHACSVVSIECSETLHGGQEALHLLDVRFCLRKECRHLHAES